MPKGQPYFAGRTKTQLRTDLRAALSKKALGEEFEASLISDLIAAKHYYCAPNDLRPSRFRKLARKGGGYNFEGYFDDHGWHGVSWNQAITPDPDTQFLKQALRKAVDQEVLQFKKDHPTCERCRVSPTEECHHASPTFDELAASFIDQLDESAWRSIWRAYDWWSAETYSIPHDLPAFATFQDAHSTCTLTAVCLPCHLSIENGDV